MSVILGVPERDEVQAKHVEDRLARGDRILAKVPQAERPIVYLARESKGLEAVGVSSIHEKIISMAAGAWWWPLLATISPEAAQA